MLKTVVLDNICGNGDILHFSGFTDEYKVKKNSIYLKYKYFATL